MQLHRVSVAAMLAACGGFCATALAQPTRPTPPHAPASPPAPQPDGKPDARLKRVEVDGQASDESIRRASTASKIVITREEIERFGDSTLGEMIKRLPGVTTGGRPGRGGQIRMRGMGNGYTQILIDGERVPRGFAIDQLSPDMVERIEIYRAPTAETGARAIAGTINIVLREPLRQKTHDLRIGVSDERGHIQPNVAWTRNDTIGSRGTYNLTLSASHSDLHTDTATDTLFTDLATGQPDLAQHLASHQHDEKNSFHLSSRVQ